MDIKINLDLSEFEADLVALQGKMPAAVASALNKTGTTAKADMARLIAADMGTPVKSAKEAVVVTRVGGTAVELAASNKQVPLIDFKARGPEPSRGKGGGVSVKLPGGQARHPNAFIATMRSGHRGVFRRVPGSGRSPIMELHGPSVGRVFSKYVQEVSARAQETLRKYLAAEIKFRRSK